MSSSRSSSHYHRGMWVPGQAVLQPTIEHNDAEVEDLDLDSMDENPIIYFLTPAPSSHCDDPAMDFDMEFDAGIEDAKHSPQAVRSVSPSSLGGFSRPPLQPPTPPRSPATPDLESDLSATPDDNEQYDYMVPSWPSRPATPSGLPHRLKDKFRGAPKQDVRKTHSLSPLSSPRSLRDSPRGRAVTKSGPKRSSASTGSSAARTRRTPGTPARLSPHAWREPSPDVWSIEEEPEQESHTEVEDGSATRYGTATRAVDIPAAKPKKRVRFVLPAMDDDGRCIQY